MGELLAEIEPVTFLSLDLSARTTGSPKDSVATVSQIIALDRSLLSERVSRLAPKPLEQILHGIDVILGR
jgi:mRNA-degrading endonuclease toxin of MazEF toxin-antitoxin module